MKNELFMYENDIERAGLGNHTGKPAVNMCVGTAQAERTIYI